MALDETLNQRIREVLKGKRGITEQKMFGGLCFMHNGNMLCGCDTKYGLSVRVGPQQYAATLKLKYAFLIPLHMQCSASTDRAGFKTVSRMDAAAERTGKYSQRVLNPALSVRRCTNSVTLNTSDRELGTLI